MEHRAASDWKRAHVQAARVRRGGGGWRAGGTGPVRQLAAGTVTARTLRRAASAALCILISAARHPRA